MKRPIFCRSAAFLPLLLFLMLSSSGAQSKTIDYGWYQKITKSVLKNARREIEPVLSQMKYASLSQSSIVSLLHPMLAHLRFVRTAVAKSLLLPAWLWH